MSDATFLDLDRIEVLKGPQSTFFGNNAVAGALNIVTKKPGTNVEAQARALYGMFGQYALEGGIGGPITDILGARVALIRSGESGWIDNIDLGEKAPRVNNEAARVTLAFAPNQDFDATFKIEGSKNQTAGTTNDQPSQWVNCPPPAPLTPTFGGTGGSCATALSLGVPMGLRSNENTGLPGQGTSLSTFEDLLTLNYRQWNHTFTSVSGFYNYHFEADIDQTHLPVQVLTTVMPEKYHQFSQEFRVASDTGGAIQYLAGLYYQTDELNFSAESNAPFANFIATIPGFEGLKPFLPIAVGQGFSQREHVYSAFGSLSWNVTDSLKLNAGLRGSKVDKNDTGMVEYGHSSALYGDYQPLPADLASLPGILLGAPGTHTLGRSDHAWMPSAGIQYQIDHDTMAYFTYTRGFKAGGINAQNGLAEPSNEQFGPEHVNAYELGIKSKWLNDTLLVNADIFRSDYKGLQVEAEIYHPQANFYSQEVGNAAASRSQGIELELQWAAMHSLRLSANVTYLDSHYVSYPTAPLTTLQQFCAGSYVVPYCSAYPNPVPAYSDLSGQQTPFAPRWSGNVAARYAVELGNGYDLVTTVNPFFSSRFNQQDPYLLGTAAYVRLDGRISLEKSGGRWAVDLIGKNLTDRLIVSGDPGLYLATKEMPRNVSAQFRFRW
jgi:iron complex outermembrane receptor protein